MATRATSLAIRDLKSLLRDGAIGGVPDGRLLDQFVAGRGESAEAAFATLVERHGPMVLGVCRRALADPRDVEDAFQATFLILARKAGSVRVDDSLGRWLYGVSRRVASRARASVGRRQVFERELATIDGRPSADDPQEDRRELRSLLDEELGRLPAKYRDPLVLCYLQGKTHEAAAHELGWPVGTVRGRLARARELMRTRLIRRGLAPAVAVLGASAEAQAAVAPVLVEFTAKGACLVMAGSGRVATWVGWELASMTLARCKLAALACLAVGATCLGMAVGAKSPPVQPQGPAPEPKALVTAPDDRKDIVGTWTSLDEVTETVAGVPRPPRIAKTTWVITADTIAMSDERGFLRHEIRYTIDSTQTPKTIDLSYRAWGGSLRGLYRLDGDELTLCYGINRPLDLEERSGVIFSKLKRESRKVDPLVSRFELAPGCLWAMEPGGSIPSSMATGGINAIVERPADGSLVVILASITKTDPNPGLEFHPVVFDAQGKRHLPAMVEGGSSVGFHVPGVELSHHKYRLDPADLPAAQAVTLGIEAVPQEARAAFRKKVGIDAFQKARAAGIDLLPWPQEGEPYEFTLKGSDGRVIRSQELKGRVVLIDFWDSLDVRCMANRPKLKELYEQRHGQGLEVLGVNFDENQDQARKALQTLGFPWPQVFVPTDEAARKLWTTAAGIESLPRLFLIDRKGVLRFVGDDEALLEETREEVARLLGEPIPDR